MEGTYKPILCRGTTTENIAGKIGEYLIGNTVEKKTDDLRKLEDPNSEIYRSLKPEEVGLTQEQMEKANAIVVYDIKKLGGENAAEGEYSQTGESPGKERKGEIYSFKLQLIHQKKLCC